eukprot:PhF_6_TR5270/c0_g1_i1/m.7671
MTMNVNMTSIKLNMAYDDMCRSIALRLHDMKTVSSTNSTSSSAFDKHSKMEINRLTQQGIAIRDISAMEPLLWQLLITQQNGDDIQIQQPPPHEMLKVLDEELSLLSGATPTSWEANPYNYRKSRFMESTFTAEHDNAVRKQWKVMEGMVTAGRGGGPPSDLCAILQQCRRDHNGMRFFCDLYVRRKLVQQAGLVNTAAISSSELDLCDPVSLTAEYCIRTHHEWNAAMRSTYGIKHLTSQHQPALAEALHSLTEALRYRIRTRTTQPPPQQQQQQYMSIAITPQSSTQPPPPSLPPTTLKFVRSVQKCGRGFLTRKHILVNYMTHTLRSRDARCQPRVDEFVTTYLGAWYELGRVTEALKTEEERFQQTWRQWERAMTQQYLHAVPMDPEWIPQQEKETGQTIYLNLRSGKTQKEHPNVLKVVATKNRQWAKAQKLKLERRVMLENKFDALQDVMDVTLPQLENHLYS